MKLSACSNEARMPWEGHRENDKKKAPNHNNNKKHKNKTINKATNGRQKFFKLWHAVRVSQSKVRYDSLSNTPSDWQMVRKGTPKPSFTLKLKFSLGHKFPHRPLWVKSTKDELQHVNKRIKCTLVLIVLYKVPLQKTALWGTYWLTMGKDGERGQVGRVNISLLSDPVHLITTLCVCSHTNSDNFCFECTHYSPLYLPYFSVASRFP